MPSAVDPILTSNEIENELRALVYDYRTVSLDYFSLSNTWTGGSHAKAIDITQYFENAFSRTLCFKRQNHLKKFMSAKSFVMHYDANLTNYFVSIASILV